MGEALAGAAAIVGIVGFGFQCLGGCITGFKLIRTALHVGKHASFLRCDLLLQEERLLLWAKRSGLSTDQLDRRLNKSLIEETISNLTILLNDVDGLKKRYKLTVKFDDPPDGKFDDPEYETEADLDFLQQSSLKLERQRILERSKTIQKTVPWPKKFWFAAVDEEKFKGLLTDIKGLISGLQDLLDNVRQAVLEDDIRFQRLQNINFATKLNHIEYLLQSFDLGAAQFDTEISVAELKAIRIAEEEEAVKVEKDKQYLPDMQKTLRSQPSTIHASLQPIIQDFLGKPRLFGQKRIRAISTYNDLPVYIDWKKYDWATRMEDTKKKALNSIVSLALLLNSPKGEEFRALQCKGILDDARAGQFQFIYDWPAGCDPHVEPKSLLEYLLGSYTPSLTERVRLALELARSMFLLHSASWLHKDFRSDNILFFPIRTDSERSLQNPFVVGFEYSRPDLEGQPSERPNKDPELDIYRHPDYLDEPPSRFRKSFDIYAFGLVLLEIAKWRPLKSIFEDIILDQHNRKRREDAEELKQPKPKELTSDERKEFLTPLSEKVTKDHAITVRSALTAAKSKRSQPTDIAFRTGTIYMEVVLTCLRDGFDAYGDGHEDGQKLQEDFFREVVKRLDVCIV
jgi:hypothetical protein